MIRTPAYSNKFKKDVELMAKSRKNIGKLKNIILILLEGKPLPERCRVHKLSGDFKNHTECHIEPDWLLIYRNFPDFILFERTGSHSQLFK